ncbi:MAG: TM0106 family RecB-like putative nuclease [Acidimicrobiales bacterium]
MSDRLVTPSTITAWLACSHYLTLHQAVESGALAYEPPSIGSLAELLVDKGNAHERECLDAFERDGRVVYRVSPRRDDETFAQWVERVGNPLDDGHDVIYQMPFAHEGVRGIADFLVRVDDPRPGFSRYEPIDAKLTRHNAKPGHVLQLCFYADALESLTGSPPYAMHLWLGSGALESLSVEQFRPYWRRLRRQLRVLLNQESALDESAPQPCDHCEVCEFATRCEAQWRAADSLIYVASIRPPERAALERGGVRTLPELAEHDAPVPDVPATTLSRLHRQASLQLATRTNPSEKPRYEMVEPGDDPLYGRGFELMPEPSDGDIFFDFEGDPFWSARDDLFFLAGLYVRDDDGSWRYEARWAHDLDEQVRMIRDLVADIARRRATFPSMHVYHYNHTERSALERLTRGTDSESLLQDLVEAGVFVDLYAVVRNALVVGTESYGLKHLERLAGFRRAGGIEQGAGAVVEYEAFMRTRDTQLLDAIARYNEDDVAATRALRDWLVRHRPVHLAWREDAPGGPDDDYDTDDLVRRLQSADPSSPAYLLSDLLNYWRRERSASTTPKFAAAEGDGEALLGRGEFIAELSLVGFEDSLNGRGQMSRYARLRWPEQSVGEGFTSGSSVLFVGARAERGYGTVSTIDRDRRELTMLWNAKHESDGVVPRVMVAHEFFNTQVKQSALVHLATQLTEPTAEDPPRRVALDLLAGAVPRFRMGRGPVDGIFRDDLDDILSWVGDLDGSYVAIQGPPGTGKTYRGAHIVYELISQGARVGITAMSHAAIDNLLRATHDVFAQRGQLERLRALRRGSGPPRDGALEGVRYSNRAGDVESEAFNLVAGTTWLWARPAMVSYPVDVLLIDEAGQLSLADAVASTNAAHNLILLGDPLQLAQVAQAEHPGGSGASVLEHVLGERATIPDTQGVFLSETRRMHPDVCRFISEQIYEGRLTSHPDCALQATKFGTGLRWLRADHQGNATRSVEEARLVIDQIRQMIGTTWTDQRGRTQPLRATDFMVVAPYNDQVDLLSDLVAADDRLGGVRVGTVDKFQGREAPVVFFTMTTSSGPDMPRGPEFLFSRNRLNVAVSRAHCLAYLVCTEELLNARARSLDDMRLIGTLSAFVEMAQSDAAGAGADAEVGVRRMT